VDVDDDRIVSDTQGAFSGCAALKSYCDDDSEFVKNGAPEGWLYSVCAVTCDKPCNLRSLCGQDAANTAAVAGVSAQCFPHAQYIFGSYGAACNGVTSETAAADVTAACKEALGIPCAATVDSDCTVQGFIDVFNLKQDVTQTRVRFTILLQMLVSAPERDTAPLF